MKNKLLQAKPFVIETNAMQNGGETGLASEQWIQLLPRKKVVGKDSRQWLNSAPDEIVSRFTAPIPVDYEHATETGMGNTAAAGWVEELSVKNRGEIWGLVKWTPKGLQDISDKYWRYISPTIEYNENTLEIQRIISVGLTNRPNLDLKALNRVEMEDTKVTEAPVIEQVEDTKPIDKPDAQDVITPEAIETALNQKQGLPEAVPTELVAQLGLPSQDVKVAMNAITDLQTRLDQAEKALNRLQVQSTAEKIVGVIENEGRGKITPAMRGDYVDIGVGMCNREGHEKGLQAFRAFVTRMPMVAQNVQFKQTELKDNELKATVEGILKGASSRKK